VAYTALLDANVLYPAPIREVLVQLATTGIYRARWSADIHREWIDALLRAEPHRDCSRPERTRDLMNRFVRDCQILRPSRKIRLIRTSAVAGCDAACRSASVASRQRGGTLER